MIHISILKKYKYFEKSLLYDLFILFEFNFCNYSISILQMLIRKDIVIHKEIFVFLFIIKFIIKIRNHIMKVRILKIPINCCKSLFKFIKNNK